MHTHVRRVLLLAGLVTAGLVLGWGRPATASVTVTFTSIRGGSQNLSDEFSPLMTMDWIRWIGDTNADFTHKATGGGAISTWTAIGSPVPTTTSDNQASSSSFVSFQWNDGDPVASNSSSNTFGAVFENTNSFGSSVNTGYTLSVTPGAAGSGKFRLFVGVGNGVGTLTATLGGSSQSLAGPTQDESGGTFSPNSGFYDITMTNVQPSDTLNLTYKITTDRFQGSGFDHAYATIMAGALNYTAVPEPASAALLGFGLAGILLRRRVA